MVDLVIIADDLTGATDTGVQFVKKGIPVFVTTSPEPDYPVLGERYSVVVIDTETRHVQPEDAALLIQKVVRHARNSEISCFYKKTDSTLRGNIGIELETLLRETGQDYIGYIPAFPKAQRTVLHGNLYVKGSLLHTTQFSSDPREPVTESYIPAVLAGQTDLPVELIRKEMILTPPYRGVVVFDGDSTEDLERAGQALHAAGGLKTVAGSAGFAEILPEFLKIAGKLSSELKTKIPEALLIVNGSLNEVSLHQVNYARAAGFVCHAITPKIFTDNFQKQAFISEIQRKLCAGSNVLITTAYTGTDLAKFEHYARLNSLSGNLCSWVAEETGALIPGIISQMDSVTVAVFGGDTSVAVFNSLGASGIELVRELTPGIGLGIAAGLKKHIVFITKSGGFGDVNVIDLLKNMPEGS